MRFPSRRLFITFWIGRYGWLVRKRSSYVTAITVDLSRLECRCHVFVFNYARLCDQVCALYDALFPWLTPAPTQASFSQSAYEVWDGAFRAPCSSYVTLVVNRRRNI